MVQVLPYVPSFGERLAETLGQAGGKVAEGFALRQQNEKAAGFRKILEDPNSTPMQKVAAFQRLPEAEKKSVAPIWAAVLGPQAQAEAEMGQLGKFQQSLGGAQPMGIPQGQPSMSPQQGQAPMQEQPMPGSQAPYAPQPVQGNQPQANFNPQDLSTYPDQLIQQMAAQKGPIGEAGKNEFKRRETIATEQRRKADEIASEDRKLLNKPAEKFFEKIEEDRERLEQEEFAGEMILSGIQTGDLDPWGKVHIGEIAKGFGAPEALVASLQTPGSKEFNTGRKQFLGSIIKDTFRGNTTQREIDIAEGLLAEVGVTREGNLAAAFALQAATDLKKERLRIADEEIAKGVSPSKIPAVVSKKMTAYAKQLKQEYFDAVEQLKKEAKHGKSIPGPHTPQPREFITY